MQTDTKIEHGPIRIFVSYPWLGVDEAETTVRRDPRWGAWRKLLHSVAEEVRKLAEGRAPAARALDIRINRLRARHGQFILHTLRQRIARGDILIMDIGSRANAELNPNVLIELGLAIGLQKLEANGLFVLKPIDAKSPSDLQGLLLTNYSIEGDAFKLEDPDGFRAALRTSLIELGESRAMIGAKKAPDIEVGDTAADE